MESTLVASASPAQVTVGSRGKGTWGEHNVDITHFKARVSGFWLGGSWLLRRWVVWLRHKHVLSRHPGEVEKPRLAETDGNLDARTRTQRQARLVGARDNLINWPTSGHERGSRAFIPRSMRLGHVVSGVLDCTSSGKAMASTLCSLGPLWYSYVQLNGCLRAPDQDKIRSQFLLLNTEKRRRHFQDHRSYISELNPLRRFDPTERILLRLPSVAGDIRTLRFRPQALLGMLLTTACEEAIAS
jgi:hypothetical protein